MRRYDAGEPVADLAADAGITEKRMYGILGSLHVPLRNGHDGPVAVPPGSSAAYRLEQVRAIRRQQQT